MVEFTCLVKLTFTFCNSPWRSLCVEFIAHHIPWNALSVLFCANDSSVEWFRDISFMSSRVTFNKSSRRWIFLRWNSFGTKKSEIMVNCWANCALVIWSYFLQHIATFSGANRKKKYIKMIQSKYKNCSQSELQN